MTCPGMQECHKDAKYVIFHSDNTSTPGAMLDSLPQELDVQFVDCRSGGNNAMDFCICALAGQLSREPGKLIRILSDDKGYDPVLHMRAPAGRYGLYGKALHISRMRVLIMPRRYRRRKFQNIVKMYRSSGQ